MIEKTYPAKAIHNKVKYKPPIVLAPNEAKTGHYTAGEMAGSVKKKISAFEFRRRQEVIQKLLKDFPHKVGDTVYPESRTQYEQLGALLILGIVQSYHEFPDDEKWPTNDNPMLLHVKGLLNKEYYNVTTNFVVGTNVHESALGTC